VTTYHRLLLASTLILTAVYAQSPDRGFLRILFWSDGEHGPLRHALEEGIEEFERSRERLPVNVEWVAPEQADGRLAELVAAGQRPDLFMSRAEHIRSHVTSGNAWALDEPLAADPEWSSRFASGVLEPLAVAGKTCGLPIAHRVALLCYNKKIFGSLGLEPPDSFGSLLAVVRQLAASAFPCPVPPWRRAT